MDQIQISIVEHVIVILDFLFLLQVYFFFFLVLSLLNIWNPGGSNTGTYLYSFGLSTTPVTGDYALATGAVIGSSKSFGTFGWDTDHTSQAVQ